MTLLTGLAAVFGIGISCVNALHTVTIYALDNSTAISYTGTSWGAFDGCNGTDYTYSKNEGFTFSFVGVSIAVFGTTSQPGGVITTTFDYQSQDTFDRYNANGRYCDVTMFRQDGLINGTHTLTMALTGNSPANSSTNGFIEWQYLTYTVLDPSDVIGASTSAVLTTSSSIIPTSDSTGSLPMPTPTPTPTPVPQSSKSNAGAIGGGIAGGIIGAALLGFLLWWCCVRKKNQDHVRADLNGPGITPAPAPAPVAQWSGGFHQQPLLVTPSYEPKPLETPSDLQRMSYTATDNSEFDPTTLMGAAGAARRAPRPSSAGSTSLPDSDVDRIAARVASMIGRQPGSSSPTSATAQEPPALHLHRGPSTMGHDQPPPMYNEKN